MFSFLLREQEALFDGLMNVVDDDDGVLYKQ